MASSGLHPLHDDRGGKTGARHSRLQQYHRHRALPACPPHDRKYSIGSQVLFDCLWPADWDPVNDVPRTVSFKNVYPKDIQEKVVGNWEAYGYPPVK